MKISITQKQSLKTMVIVLVAIFACCMQKVEAQSIVANDDIAFMSRYGSSGGFNVLSNDLLAGIPVGPSQVIITITAPDPNGYLILNTTTGVVNIPVTAPLGTYSLSYSICDLNNPSICDNAVVTVHAIDAPVVAVDNFVTTATTAAVVIRAADIRNFGSCNLQFNYDPAIATAVNIVKAPGIPGNIASAVPKPGEVRCGWYASPGIFFPDDTPIFIINFTKVTNGTTAITWDNSYNQRMSDGYSRSFVMDPAEDFLLPGSLTFQGDAPVTVKVLLEGLYNTTNGNMNKAKDFDGANIIDEFAGTIADLITVELHDPDNYGSYVHIFENLPLHQNGTASFNADGVSGSYYLTIKSRNHLEIVSATPVTFGPGTTEYDFTTAASKAYGNNQAVLGGVKYGMYAGDVDQNGIININDVGPVNAGIIAGERGYVVKDINGDGIININDAGPLNANIISGRVRRLPQ